MDSQPGHIDFQSNIPYYVQLINLLHEKINRGIWKSGEQIPGEQELCLKYGVSRTVVRQALHELELQGVIRRRRGKGTFVAEPKISESLAQKLTGFYQDMVERGFKPITKVLHQKVVRADDQVARFLEIESGTPVLDIYRLRFVKEEPIQLVNTYIPYSLCPQLADADLSSQSLYAFLESQCGVHIARGRRFIEAVAARAEEARLLKVKPGSPLILLDSVSYLEDGRPVEYYHAVHRGDRSRFEVELVRVKKSPQSEWKEIHPWDLPNSEDFYKEGS